MTSLLTLPAGRRAKWFIGAAWLLLIAGVVAAELPQRFSDAQENDSASFLPADAESTAALERVEALSQGVEIAPLVVVYARAGGLTGADRRRIDADRAAFNADLPAATTPAGAPVLSRDGTTALVIAEVRGDGEAETIIDPVEDYRERIEDLQGDAGLQAKVTGPAGISADAIEIFESIDGVLLLATLSLVVFLLVVIYRSPVFWIFPVLAVVFALFAAQGLAYALHELLGVTINGQSAGIMPVLVLGAGTDYALLLVARYREELRRHDDRHEAMRLALRAAGPAIVASGATVIAALLCLTLADVEGTAGLGPVGAVGILVAVVSLLTLLPALLLAIGRRWVFWPRIPHVGAAGADETHGAWRRVGERVAASPRRVWLGATALLLVLTLGWLNIDLGLTNGNSFRGEVQSVQGQELIEQAFPAGQQAPTEIVLDDPADAPAVTRAVAAAPGVESVRPDPRGPTLLNAVLEVPPYSTQAFDLVPGIRAAARRAGGPQTLVGGASAIERDLRVASARDTRVIIPIALAVVFLILVGLLRSLVAPLLLVGTVILSFAAALGVGYLVFDWVFGFPGSDPSLPLYAFVFLVALGVDYNIFLMARVREETLRHGTRAGMLRGLAVTGAVITSAGIVLAGTFSTLAVLPIVFLTEIGFVVAFGVLLDTFLVRSVLVPALVFDLGPKTWLPSRIEPPEGRAAPGIPEPELVTAR